MTFLDLDVLRTSFANWYTYVVHTKPCSREAAKGAGAWARTEAAATAFITGEVQQLSREHRLCTACVSAGADQA